MAMLSMSLSGVNPRLALALLCVVALTHAYEKRAESESGLVSPVPFTFAARYGRSPERLITPRNDRWMMTTRYGKRSDLSTMEEDPPSASLRGEERVARTLSCEYTGVLMLYRCARTNGRALAQAQFVRRSTEDLAKSEEE